MQVLAVSHYFVLNLLECCLSLQAFLYQQLRLWWKLLASQEKSLQLNTATI